MGIQIAASVETSSDFIRSPGRWIHKGLNSFTHDDNNIFSNNKPLNDSVSFLFDHIKRRELTAFVLGDASL